MLDIAILLATYNGERYLSQQLDSIICQTNQNWTLYIRDDGSSDSTIQILKDYEQNNSKIIILNDLIKNRGAMNSFIWLMENVKSDYYMFCDQDDVWLSNKIEVCYSELKNNEEDQSEIPLIVFTDLFVVDESLNIISNSMWEYSRLKFIMSQKYLLVGTYVTGCTMFFNNKAKEYSLKYTKKALMHDSLLALSTSFAGGKVVSIPKALIYYRQHKNNALGISKFDNSIISKFLKIKDEVKVFLKYYRFSNSVTGISFLRYMLLKLEIIIRVRRHFPLK